MRRLMWLTIGFAAGCGCLTWLGQKTLIPFVGLAVFAVLAAVLMRRRFPQILRPAGALFLGVLLGTGWFLGFQSVVLQPVVQLDNTQRNARILISDYSENGPYGARADGLMELDDRSCQVYVYLKDTVELAPGDRISGAFRFRLTTPQGREESEYFYSRGIFLLAYQADSVTVEKSGSVPTRFRPALIRQQIKHILQESFPADAAAFVRALLLGDTSLLDYETDTDLKISGIRHIVAVSGLHVSMIYGFVCMMTLRRRFLTAAVGIPALVLFAAVAGFTPSVTRACLMILLMLLAQVFEREYDPPTALAFAVLVILMMNPYAVASVSLQMSAGCVAGILLFQQPVQGWMKKWIPEKFPRKTANFLCSGISVTVGAMSLTTPLCAYYFGMVSVVGIVTNLLTLWMVTGVFGGTAAVCLLYLLSPAAAKLVGTVLAWGVRYVLSVAGWMADLPFAAIYMDIIYTLAWLVFVYILLAVFLCQKEKQPGILLCCGCIGLCVAMMAAWTEPTMDSCRFTVLDVGQGQCILLQSEGKNFLVDCGGDDAEETADIVAGNLLSQGITCLDGIILTHFDADHAGALENLLCRVDTKLLLIPDLYDGISVPSTDGSVIYVWEDLKLTCGNTQLTVFGPVYSAYDNENSLCVLFDTEKCDILITGDRAAFGERMLLEKNLPDVDVLVAGHHGAADSTSEALLQAVLPETVVISVGKDNLYGHPAPALLQRLADFGCRVYRTDLNGTVIIRR